MIATEAGLVGALVLGGLAFLGTVITGVLAYLQSKRTTEATSEVGIIEAAQRVQDETIKTQREELVELRAEVRALKAEIRTLEAEVDRLTREAR